MEARSDWRDLDGVLLSLTGRVSWTTLCSTFTLSFHFLMLMFRRGGRGLGVPSSSDNAADSL